MKKELMALTGILLALATIPTAFATSRNTVGLNTTNNVSSISAEALSGIEQLTSKPEAGVDQIQFKVELNVTTNGTNPNVTDINYTLPDTAVNTTVASVNITNGTSSSVANSITGTTNKTAEFIGLDFSVSNHSILNVTFYLKSIAETDEGSSKSDSTKTHKWNITNRGSDLNVTGIKVVVAPSQFDLRTDTTSVSSITYHGSTPGNYTVNTTHLTVYDLTANSTYWLNVSYTLPSESPSSGGSPSEVPSVAPPLSQQQQQQIQLNTQFGIIVILLIGILVAGGVVILWLNSRS